MDSRGACILMGVFFYFQVGRGAMLKHPSKCTIQKRTYSRSTRATPLTGRPVLEGWDRGAGRWAERFENNHFEIIFHFISLTEMPVAVVTGSNKGIGLGVVRLLISLFV